jgi:hypothetical protein
VRRTLTWLRPDEKFIRCPESFRGRGERNGGQSRPFGKRPTATEPGKTTGRATDLAAGCSALLAERRWSGRCKLPTADKFSRRIRFNSLMVCGRANEPCGPGTINSDWAPARCELQYATTESSGSYSRAQRLSAVRPLPRSLTHLPVT